MRTLDVAFRTEDFVSSQVVLFQERQVLGRPAEATVTVFSRDYFEIENMVGAKAELVHGYPQETECSFWGIIESATIVGQHRADAATPVWEYRMRVVSHVALLARAVTSEIHQEKDVKEIVSSVLEYYFFPSDRVEWRLTGSYPKREYCVQYQESALDFISRLLEEEGIYFFTEGEPEKGEKLIFADDSSAAAEIEGGAELPKRSRAQMSDVGDAVFTIRDRHRVRSGKVVLKDYDFKRPKLDLTSEVESDIETDLELYDYPGCYVEPSEGKRLAQVRLEAEQVARHTLEIKAVCPRIAVGRKLKISDADEFDGEYLVTGVRREYEYKRGGAPSAEGAAPDEGGEKYVVMAELIPLAVKFRSAQITPKPVIRGPQTARVMAPEGAAVEEIHTDEHGRAKLKFFWDRTPIEDDKASAWMRVSQLQTSGSMVLPRVNWEVIVEFLEGDPDKPMVTGRLYNGVFMPPYQLPEGRTRTSLRTSSTPGGGGTNEIRFEDKAGAEEIMIQSQHNTTVKAANNKTKNVGNNDKQNIAANSSLEVGGNQEIKVTKGNLNDVTGDQSVSVGGNRKREVNAVYGLSPGGSATTTVGGNQFMMIGNPLEGLLAVAAERAAEALAAAADNLVGQVEGMVQGAVGQVMGPVDNIVGQAQQIGQAMDGVANGDLSGAGQLVAGASGLPGASAAMSGLTGPPPAAAQTAPGAEVSAGVASGANALRAAATSAIQSGMSAARNAVGEALGAGGGGGGGSSGANAAGPDGAAGGVDESNTSKGPGHNLNTVAASHSETSAGLRVMAALNGINTNVTGSQTQTIGAAYVEMVLGSHAESAEAMKSETQLGYVVVTGGDETETVDGAKTQLVGGAVVNLIKGTHSVTAGAPATFIGAFHKMQAKTSVTFKCGGAELVVDGGGVTLSAPMVMMMSPKIQLAKKVSDA